MIDKLDILHGASTRRPIANFGTALLLLGKVRPPLPGFSDRRTRSRPLATSATSPKARSSGRSHFYGIQRGPTSPGRGWLLDVTNVSVTPYTYTEDFTGNERS